MYMYHTSSGLETTLMLILRVNLRLYGLGFEFINGTYNN